MPRFRVFSAIASLCLAVIGVSCLATAASASAKPAVSFAFASNKVSAEHPISISYSSSGLPTGSSLFLQRQEGTAHAWKDVEKLNGAAGTETAPGVPIGKYLYRIQVRQNTKAVAVSPSKVLYAYGTVPLASLCNNPGVIINAGNGCPFNGSTQIGGRVFPYVVLVTSNEGSVYPSFYNLIDFPATTCRSIAFSFGMPVNGSQSGDTAYLETIEQTRDPQMAGAGFGVLKSLHAKLDGHPWFLENSASNGADEIAINGKASCYTPSGY